MNLYRNICRKKFLYSTTSEIAKKLNIEEQEIVKSVQKQKGRGPVIIYDNTLILNTEFLKPTLYPAENISMTFRTSIDEIKSIRESLIEPIELISDWCSSYEFIDSYYNDTERLLKELDSILSCLEREGIFRIFRMLFFAPRVSEISFYIK